MVREIRHESIFKDIYQGIQAYIMLIRKMWSKQRTSNDASSEPTTLKFTSATLVDR